MKYSRVICSAGLLVAAMGIAFATDFNESEANDSKLTANAFTMVAGDRIIGNSTSAATTGLDYFRVTTSGGSGPGIYQNRLVITTTGTAGHTGTIRGLSQSGTGSTFVGGNVVPGTGGTIGTTDSTVQTSSTTTTPARFNQWYTFGTPADIYYRVTGATATTADYVATLESVQITPTFIGTFTAGSINISTIGQGHTTDTDLWVLDSNFNAIPGYGNDDYWTSTGTSTLQSSLTRNYAAGTYYLAIANFNTANNLASPTDERTPSGSVMDFAGTMANSSTTTNVNISFAVTDSSGTPVNVAATRAGAYDVNFYRFNVAPVPEPATMAVLGVGLLAVLRRRKKA